MLWSRLQWHIIEETYVMQGAWTHWTLSFLFLSSSFFHTLPTPCFSSLALALFHKLIYKCCKAPVHKNKLEQWTTSVQRAEECFLSANPNVGTKLHKGWRQVELNDWHESQSKRMQRDWKICYKTRGLWLFLLFKGSLYLQLHWELLMYLLEMTQLRVSFNETNFDKEMVITWNKGVFQLWRGGGN